MKTLNRRSVLKKSLIGLSYYTLSNIISCNKNPPKITILGGGIAGLYAAYRLKKAGIVAPIYEAHSRTGGRVMTGQNFVAKGITTEIGGEFIDSSHKELLDLCQEFGFTLLDMQSPSEVNLVKTDYFIDGQRRTNPEIIEGFRNYPQVLKDMLAVEKADPIRYSQLDKYSIDEYLHSVGMTGWLANLLKTSFTSELGLDTDIQNCITMLGMISLDFDKNKFEIYGDSDERYKVIGGNDKIVKELAKRVENQINVDYVVEKISRPGNNYKVFFENGQSIESDIIILTLPFTALRNVKLDFEMPKMKRKCINELDYGTQSKLFFGFKERFWRDNNFSGYVLSDKVHNGWDSSQMQTNNQGNGSYTLFMGGKRGFELNAGQGDKYLLELEGIYKGAKENYITHNAYNWAQNPFAGGAYSCYKPNQMTTIAGWESKPVDNVYFAGEHCSEHFGGYMYGALETSKKVVESILKLMQ